MEKLREAVIKKSVIIDGVKKLPCSVAFIIASEFDVKPSEIGKVCNEENIRICKCQLGCFE